MLVEILDFWVPGCMHAWHSVPPPENMARGWQPGHCHSGMPESWSCWSSPDGWSVESPDVRQTPGSTAAAPRWCLTMVSCCLTQDKSIDDLMRLLCSEKVGVPSASKNRSREIVRKQGCEAKQDQPSGKTADLPVPDLFGVVWQ